MSVGTLYDSDRSRPVKHYTVGGSLAILLLSVAVIAGVVFWLASMMPNPVTFYEDVVIKPQAAVAGAEVHAQVAECRAEQAAVDLKTSPTTSPQCHPFEYLVRSGPEPTPSPSP